jgi:hypothetical protein
LLVGGAWNDLEDQMLQFIVFWRKSVNRFVVCSWF